MVVEGLNICEISSKTGVRDSALVIRNAFRTVAQGLHLTRANCPTHPSFITIQKLTDLKNRGLIFFGGFSGGIQICFVALEQVDDYLYYLEKLAVLPGYRHHGYGEKLVRFTINYVQNHGVKKISIGTIDEQTILKEWYKKLGFRQVSTRKFEHLPFTVCYMEIDIP